MRPGVEEREMERIDRAGRRRDRDRLAVEAPLEIRVRGEPRVTVMRTPGEDLELARGLLYAEGVLRTREEAAAVREVEPGGLGPLEAGNVIEIDLDAALFEARWPERSLPASSACGVCGKTSIAALEPRVEPIRSDLAVPADLIARLPAALCAAQERFHATGGLHAAAAFDREGRLLAVREDVGRHNAVDKLVGWALAAGRLPLAEAILCVSGRAGFEIVQKAAVAGFPIAVAVSAPSSMAVDLAERSRLTLCGFVRDGRLNVYTHPARIEGGW